MLWEIWFATGRELLVEDGMVDVVRDRYGNRFAVEASGAPLCGDARLSLRPTTECASDARDVLCCEENFEVIARVLVCLGACSPSTVTVSTDHELRRLTQACLERGLIRFAPYMPRFRPACDIDSVLGPGIDLVGRDDNEVPTTHTLELELIEEDGTPIPHEPYRVTLPDGDVLDGVLNAQGRALVTGIVTAGSCDVAFPELDDARWDLDQIEAIAS